MPKNAALLSELQHPKQRKQSAPPVTGERGLECSTLSREVEEEQEEMGESHHVERLGASQGTQGQKRKAEKVLASCAKGSAQVTGPQK